MLRTTSRRLKSIFFLGVGIGVGGIRAATRPIPVSEDEVILSWLQSEARDPHHQFAKYYRKAIEDLGKDEKFVLDNPNLSNEAENKARRQVFNSVRGKYKLWQPIHQQTVWYRRRMFLPSPFHSLFSAWPAERTVDEKQSTGHKILWGHSFGGPLFILEGNHRWTAQRKNLIPRLETVYVGISKQPYTYHALTGCEQCMRTVNVSKLWDN